MTMPPEQAKAKAYLLEKGTQAPIAQIRERVAEAFAAMDTLLDGVTEAQARRAPGAGDRLSPRRPDLAGLSSVGPVQAAARRRGLRVPRRRLPRLDRLRPGLPPGELRLDPAPPHPLAVPLRVVGPVGVEHQEERQERERGQCPEPQAPAR